LIREGNLYSTPPRRERIAVIQSLSAGTIPAVGLRALQVGRTRELQAILDDLDRAQDGLSTVRFVSGPPESGKTFLMNLSRTVAVERGFLAVRGNLSPRCRLCASSGEARAFFRELMTNISTRDSDETITIGWLLQNWIEGLERSVKREGGSADDVRARLVEAVSPLHELTHGFDYATVLLQYWDGYVSHDDALQENALRWLRAEYASVVEANNDLGVRTIIDDDSLREAFNLFSTFTKLAGYMGLLVIADELTAISRRVKDASSRNSNYEAIVQLLDDCLAGRIRWMVMLFGIEDSCVQDRQRGLHSNEMLAGRLTPNRFALNGRKDYSLPVIMLEGLTIADFQPLLRNVRNLVNEGDDPASLISDESIAQYIETCQERIGKTYFNTPRTVVKDFIGLLHMLRQDPKASWGELLDSAEASMLASRNMGGVGAIDDYSAAPLWLRQPPRTRPRSWYPGRWVAAILLPVLLVVVVAVTAAVLYLPHNKIAADLQVKCSDTRGGLRLPLSENTLPRGIGTYYSAAVTLSEPLYVYILTVDANGYVRLLFGDDEEPTKTELVVVPGADTMLPLVDPPGTRTVLMFASKTALPDARKLKVQIQSLAHVPNIRPMEMLVLKGGTVEMFRNTEIPVDPNMPISDRGFLTTLTEEFSEQFDVVQAVSFPLVAPTGDRENLTVYDYENP